MRENLSSGAAQPLLVVVRHGETEWSKLGKHTSHTDLDLTEAGAAGARALAVPLASHVLTRVASSPLQRARKTAELAGFAAEAIVDPDLTEWNYGNDEGRTTKEIRVARPGWSIWKDGPQGGETLAQVCARADRFLASVLSAEGCVLAFAHGHILDVLAARWLGLEASAGRMFHLDPATISVFGWHHEDRVLRQWNGR
jgi:broad specificity phosphatase PhoE